MMSFCVQRPRPLGQLLQVLAYQLVDNFVAHASAALYQHTLVEVAPRQKVCQPRLFFASIRSQGKAPMVHEVDFPMLCQSLPRFFALILGLDYEERQATDHLHEPKAVNVFSDVAIVVVLNEGASILLLIAFSPDGSENVWELV